MLQGRVGAHKLGVVGNTIYVLLQISSGMLLLKIMKISSRIKKLLQKYKGNTECVCVCTATFKRHQKIHLTFFIPAVNLLFILY